MRKASDLLRDQAEIRDQFVDDEAQMSVVALDLDLKIEVVNRGFLRVVGFVGNEASLIGRDIASCLDQESMDIIRSIDAEGIVKASLGFLSGGAGVFVLRTTIFTHAAGHVLFAEQLQLTEESILSKMTQLTNELSGLTRTLQKKNRELEQAQSHIKVLQGMLPICASCKSVRDDDGYWQQIETYIHDRSDVEFSHGMCPNCMKEQYPEIYEKYRKQLEHE